MPIKWLLFDVDNTLLDFSGASKKAMWNALLSINIICTEDIYQNYESINHNAWKAFERNQITAIELRSRRMKLFLDSLGITNHNPFEFNATYLEELVKVSSVYENVDRILHELKKKGYLMSIVTNGFYEVQRPRLKKVGLYHLFDSIIVSDEIGISKPDIEFFEYTSKTLDNIPPKSQTLIIGDNLSSDILGGLNFGIQTCWIHHGKMNESTITPHYSIETINQLQSLLNQLI